MGLYKVEVQVALSRPPRNDATIFYQIEAEDGLQAELLACIWSTFNRRVVMPVASVVTDWPDEVDPVYSQGD